MLTFLTAGESHGKGLTVILEGIPAGVAIDKYDINTHLKRRMCGYGRGGRMKIEKDQVLFLSGIRGGISLGTPICMQIANLDWKNWSEIMTADPDCRITERRVTLPRPGHADLAGGVKYRHRDMRNVLERASARETAARVACASVVRKLLSFFDIHILSYVYRIGEAEDQNNYQDQELLIADQSEVRTLNKTMTEEMKTAIDSARKNGDSVGGCFQVRVTGVPPGLGSYSQWDRRLESSLSASMMSIPGIKGVEIGLGFKGAALPGSKVHDEINYNQDINGFKYGRTSNNAGGIEGGVSNGETLVINGAMKPIPTLISALQSVVIESKNTGRAAVERSDCCAVPAASIVGEAMAALVVGKEFLNKFNGDFKSIFKK